MIIEVSPTNDGKLWWFTIKSKNGYTIARSIIYKRKEKCVKTAQKLSGAFGIWTRVNC